MVDKDKSSATMRMFGSQLRLWRIRAQYSREQFGQEAGYAAETVASVEQGRRMPATQLVEAAETLFGAGGMLQDAAAKIVRAKFPDWFEDYVRYEAEAVSLGIYATHVIPGLFQTEAYARAVFGNSCPPLDESDIEDGVAARLERQILLERKPLPLISAVIEEVTLHRRVGGRAVLRGQIQRLLALSALRHVHLQVMPTDREAHAGLGGPMSLVETSTHQLLVYFDGPKGGVLLSDPKDTSDLNMRYATLRAQALTPEETLGLLKQRLGDL